MNAPAIQHWLVQVARAANLEGASDLAVDANEDTNVAWSAVSSGTGVSTDRLVSLVAQHYSLESADLESADGTATALLPRSVALKHCVLPLRYSERMITVASADPHSLDKEREIAQLADRHVVFEVATPAAISDGIQRAYPPSDRDRHVVPALTGPDDGTLHILVVDDDPEMRLLLRSVLQSGGFTVTEAPDGPEALEEMGRKDFNLVTLDLRMQKMHGLDVLKRIRETVQTSHVPVIVATASGTPETEIAALERGADDFVVKPIDPPRFLLRIQAVLKRYGSIGPGHPY